MKYALNEVFYFEEAKYYWLAGTQSALSLRGSMPCYDLIPFHKMIEKYGLPNRKELPNKNSQSKYDENDIYTEKAAAMKLWSNAAPKSILKYMEEIEKLAERGEIDARAIINKSLDKKGQKYYIVVLSQVKNKLMN